MSPTQLLKCPVLWTVLPYYEPWAEALWESAIRWLDRRDKPNPVWVRLCVCAWKRVLLGFVWVFMSAACSLSRSTIGSVNELLLVECVCVCARAEFVCTFFSLQNEGLRWEEYWSESLICLVWDVNCLARFCYITDSAIDLQAPVSMYVRSHLQGYSHARRQPFCFLFCAWVRCRVSIHFLTDCNHNTGVFSKAGWRTNMPL